MSSSFDGAPFDGSSPIVDCDPNCLPKRYAESRWLLWPVWAFRVAVPAVRLRRLNLFQHYTLALAARGVRRADAIGERLDLGTDLAAFVLDELVGMGRLNPDRSPSESGRRYLEEYDEQEPEIVPGYVFRDGFTGRLWPRFVPGGPRYVDLAGDGYLGGRPLVERGTPGKPRRRRCRTIRPARGTRIPGPPTASGVRRACRTWARHLDSWERVSGRGPADWAGQTESLRRLGQGRITVLSRAPVSTFVTTFLFLPEHGDEGSPWHVCDPFGLGTSPRLRRRIEHLIDDGHEHLGREVDALTLRAREVRPSEVVEARRRRTEAARSLVRSQLSGLGCPEALRVLLVQMEGARVGLRMHRGGSGAGSWKEKQRHLARIVRRAWEACEELFAWLTETWAGPDLLARVGQSAEDNAGLLSRLASALGFDNDDTLDSLGRLLLVSRGRVRGVLEFDNRELPAMAAAGLLATADDSAHPLHDAARRMPSLFVFLDRLKRTRDPVAHHGGASLEVGTDDWVCDGVYAACAALLPPSAEPETLAATGPRGDLQWAVKLAHSLRARAVQSVEARFGSRVREFPKIRRELIEVARLREELDFVGEGETGLAKDLLIAGGAALEGVMVRLLSASSSPLWVTAQSRDEIHAAARAQMEELGLDEGPDVERVLRASAERVQRAAREGRGPLSTVAMVALLATRDDDDHPLRALARVAPDFLTRVGSIASRRRHGDTALGLRGSLAFADDIQDLCYLVLEYID